MIAVIEKQISNANNFSLSPSNTDNYYPSFDYIENRIEKRLRNQSSYKIFSAILSADHKVLVHLTTIDKALSHFEFPD